MSRRHSRSFVTAGCALMRGSAVGRTHTRTYSSTSNHACAVLAVVVCATVACMQLLCICSAAVLTPPATPPGAATAPPATVKPICVFLHGFMLTVPDHPGRVPEL